MTVVPVEERAFCDTPMIDVAQFFEAVTKPIVVYNVPGRTGVNLEPETLARLVDAEDRLGVFEQFHFRGHWLARNDALGKAVRRVAGQSRPGQAVHRSQSQRCVQVVAQSLQHRIWHLARHDAGERFQRAIEPVEVALV